MSDYTTCTNRKLTAIATVIAMLIGLSTTNVLAEPYPGMALFGDLHVHTSWSLDAYMFKTRTSPDDAYRFAKGEPLQHPLGRTYQLSRPLDFMAVTDHAAYLGMLINMRNPDHPLSKLDWAQRIFSENMTEALAAFLEVTGSMRTSTPIAELIDSDNQSDTWQKMIKAANRHNDPGRFTALIGYEWTAVPDGQNLHRNVIFEGDSAPIPFSALDSGLPEDLWNWMDMQRSSGFRLIAIPHNSNLSNGRMFENEDSHNKPFTAEYAAQRNRNEPLVEVTQIKGTSETHPLLSPDDQFANFELVEQQVASSTPITKFKGSYVRDAYRAGLEFQDALSANPYKFGLIGSTDSHTSILPILESDYSGKQGVFDGSASARLLKKPKRMDYRKFSASGLAAVWATENSRKGVFQALERKESWATTGPRIQLRFFAGWDMSDVKLADQGWVKAAYHAGVPMGGTLNTGSTDKTPTFIVWALKDVEGANLERIQIVKGWSKGGKSDEMVYDLVLSEGRKVKSTRDETPVADNTVDMEIMDSASINGENELSVRWTDPDFDPTLNAFYYVRVIEIPTPRWSTYDADELGIEVPRDLPVLIQERAFSSPIWYEAE